MINKKPETSGISLVLFFGFLIGLFLDVIYIHLRSMFHSTNMRICLVNEIKHWG